MKKGSDIALISVTAAFALFTAGFFFGRSLLFDAVPVTIQLPQIVENAMDDLSDIELSGDERLNINTATAEELDALPGIGPAIAQRIIEYREQHGPFADLKELANVEGIGPGTILSFADLITVEE